MIRLDQKAARERAASAEREQIFEIVGDDGTVVAGSIPRVIDAAAVVRYLDNTADRGQEAAMAELLRELLDAEGYDALVQYVGLDAAELDEIFRVVEDRMSAQVQRTGKSGKRRSKR
jgi:hypothetical protein